VARKGWSITLIGAEEAKRMLQKAQGVVNSEAAQDAILPAAKLIRDTAKRLVVLGPGKTKNGQPRKHLRELIFATKGKRATGITGGLARAIYGDASPSVIVGIDLKKAPHAHLVEFGHAGPNPAPAHPFLRPAADSCRPLVKQIIENNLRALLAQFSK
jgi:HK97 gp10 family phage protein